uniref:NTF2 domain-containing protein n=1 Tax=Gouania willdenowi TaxID=441366 RepID=A0A8C5HZB9_GOUWI
IVMEKPSPLVVGQEFVRQYYKVLNEAPASLHRFYGNKSSYIHGGLDPNGKLAEAVYEPKEIHKKVMSLQFSECCAEISHVNAHAMLSDGVMVQVLGELSNSGQPMRKFMQTFVLAPDVSIFMRYLVHLKNHFVPFWFIVTMQHLLMWSFFFLTTVEFCVRNPMPCLFPTMVGKRRHSY